MKLLVSDWDHSRPSIRNYVKSLASLNLIDEKVSVEAKMFKVNFRTIPKGVFINDVTKVGKGGCNFCGGR